MHPGLRTTAFALVALLAAGAAPAQTAQTLRVDASHDFTVYVAGPRDAADGIVLVHDFFGVSPFFLGAEERLAKRGYRVVAVDLYDGRRATTHEDALALLRGLDTDIALLTGFSELDMEALLGTPASKDKGAQADVDLPIISWRGDIWTLGNHRLMCGDSCCAADVDRLVDGQSVRLVITDPPYNVSYEAKVADQATQSVRRATSRIENDSMEDASFRQFLLDFYAQACLCPRRCSDLRPFLATTTSPAMAAVMYSL
jgi:hypothetical protein